MDITDESCVDQRLNRVFVYLLCRFVCSQCIVLQWCTETERSYVWKFEFSNMAILLFLT